MIQLPPLRSELGHPDEVVGLSLARSSSDFTDDERVLLQLLQPIFAGTLRRLHDAAHARAIATAVDGSTQLSLLVDRMGRIAWLTPAAEDLLDTTVGHSLPAHLRA